MNFSAQGAFATSYYGTSTYDYTNTDGLIIGPEDFLNSRELGIDDAPLPASQEVTKVVDMQEMTRRALGNAADQQVETKAQIIFIRGGDDPSVAREIVEEKRQKPVDNNVEFRQSVVSLSPQRAYALLNTLTYAKEAGDYVFRPTDTNFMKRDLLIESLWILRQDIKPSNKDYSLSRILNYAAVIDERFPANEDKTLQNAGWEGILEKMYHQEIDKEIEGMVKDINEAKELRHKLLNLNSQSKEIINTKDLFKTLVAIWRVFEDFRGKLESTNQPAQNALKMLGNDLSIIANHYDIANGPLVDIRTKKFYEMMRMGVNKHVSQQKDAWIANLQKQMQDRKAKSVTRNIKPPINMEEINRDRAEHKPLINRKDTAPMPAETQSQMVSQMKKVAPKQKTSTSEVYIVPDAEDDDYEEETPKLQQEHVSSLDQALNFNELDYDSMQAKRMAKYAEEPTLKANPDRKTRTAGSYETKALPGVSSRKEDDAYDVNQEPTYGIPIKQAIDSPSGSMKRQEIEEDSLA